jgi:ABC-type sugar transport system ATPase subunit
VTEAVLRVRDLAKAFGPTQALRSATFDLRPGEVHALVGENGSGKSTLVKILAGVHRPDGGTIELGGTPFAVRGPGGALGRGIATVFQEVLVVGSQTVLDNVWLGSDGPFRTKIAPEVKKRRAAQVLTRLLGTAPDPNALVETLSLSDRQACGIARALVRDPKVLVLDEATSALDIATRDRLFTVVAGLRDQGVSTIFISHRMDEIDEICDRVTVLRSGSTVETLPCDEADTETLVHLMTGAERLTAEAAVRTREPGGVVLEVRDLRLRPDSKPIELDVHAGEIIGLAGLEGHGQDHFLRALWGEAPSGRVSLHGAELRSRRQAARQGIAYVPRDRRGEALFGPLSIAENFAAVTERGITGPGSMLRRFRPYAERLGIKLGSGHDPITTLSGGNQQKVVMARWLAAEPKVLLLNDPTRGVDLGAKRDLYALLTGLAAEGVAVVMLSTEVDEHLELMDRVLVFREGEVRAVLPRDGLDRQILVANFFGGEQ